VTVAHTVEGMETTTTTTQTTDPTAVDVETLARWLALQTWSTFAQSVAAYYHRNGHITPAQEAAARRMVETCLRREAERAADRAAAAEFVAGMARDEVAVGFYVGPNDIIWHVKRGRAGQTYARRHDDATGEFVFVAGAMRGLLADLNRGTLRPLDTTTAGRIGRRTGRCLVCSKALTDPASVAAGIGPVCASRL
jgi:hypothetical protein